VFIPNTGTLTLTSPWHLNVLNYFFSDQTKWKLLGTCRQSMNKCPTTCTIAQDAWGRCCGEPLSLCMPGHLLQWLPPDAAAMYSNTRCCPTIQAQECDFPLHAPKYTQCALSPGNVLSIHYSALTPHLATSQINTTEGAYQRKMLLTWWWDEVKLYLWV